MRHGEREYGSAEKEENHPLSERGLERVEAAGRTIQKRLWNDLPDAIFSGTYTHARQTAETICEVLGLSIPLVALI